MKRFEEIGSYGCYLHPERSGVGICTKCGVVVCDECAELVSGRIYCPEHKPERRETDAGPATGQKTRPAILIPLLLIIALIALALWYAPNLTSDLFGSYNRSVTELELQEIGDALESFRDDVGRYPTNEEGLLALREEPAGADGWLGPYLPDGVFIDDNVVDTSGNPIGYELQSEGYRLGAAGPDGKFDTNDDVVLESLKTTE